MPKLEFCESFRKSVMNIQVQEYFSLNNWKFFYNSVIPFMFFSHILEFFYGLHVSVFQLFPIC